MENGGGWVCRLTYVLSIVVSSMVLQVPPRKWIDISMDIVGGLPRTQNQYDSIWVVVYRLTKSAHFIPVKTTYLAEEYTRIIIDEIVCCNGFL